MFNQRILIVALPLFLAAETAFIAANCVYFTIIDDVNRKLPQNEQIPIFGEFRFTLGPRRWQPLRLYRAIYPEGRLFRYYWILIASAFALLLASVFLVQFGAQSY